MNNALLSWIIFAPLCVAAVVMFVPRVARKTMLVVGYGGLLLQTVAVIEAWVSSWSLPSEVWYHVQKVPWWPAFGVSYHVAVDQLSLWMLLLLTGLSLLSFGPLMRGRTARRKETIALFLMLNSMLAGAFCARDLVLFYVFFEASLIPVLMLSGMWGASARIGASRRFFVYTAVGSLALLLSMLVLARQQMVVMGAYNADIAALSGLPAPFSLQVALFLGFMLAFMIKAPLFPFHAWQADLYAASPSSLNVVVAGVMSKLGLYGMLRVAIPLFPLVSAYLAPTLVLLAVLSVVYGGLCAWVQRDLKRMMAYSSLSHIGTIAAGIFALSSTGWSGSVVQMLSHGVITGGIFLLLAHLESKGLGTRLPGLGGLAGKMPMFSFCMVVFFFASMGLPGLSNFPGELMILLGVMRSTVLSPWTLGFLGALSLAVIISAMYGLRALRYLCWGVRGGDPVAEAAPGHTHEDPHADTDPNDPKASQRTSGLWDMPLVTAWPVAVLLLCCVGLGLRPAWVTEQYELVIERGIEAHRKQLQQQLQQVAPGDTAAAWLGVSPGAHKPSERPSALDTPHDTKLWVHGPRLLADLDIAGPFDPSAREITLTRPIAGFGKDDERFGTWR